MARSAPLDVDDAGVGFSAPARSVVARRSVVPRFGGRARRLAVRPAPRRFASFLVAFQSPGVDVAGLSADGDAIVGTLPRGHPAGLGEAVLWTVADGEVLLTPDAEFSRARAISADGSRVLVERGRIEGPVRTAFWSPDAGFSAPLDLGLDFDGTPLGMSDDTRFLVGVVDDDGSGESRAWSWSEETGVTILPTPFPGGGACVASDVSDDGRIVVGSCTTPFVDLATPQERAAVRWRHGVPTILETSGPLSRVRLDPPCQASAVSRDGRIAIGGCRGTARRWSGAAPSALDDPTTGWTTAHGLTPDGRLIVGTWTEEPQRAGIPTPDPKATSAVVWLPSGEMRPLADLLADVGLGPALTHVERLSTAAAVSDDGHVITGTAVLTSQGDTDYLGVYRAALPYLPRARVPTLR